MTRATNDRDDAHPVTSSSPGLRRNIALLMRIGMLLASGLLTVGVILGWIGADDAATAFIVSGCAAFILLPILRLLLMLAHFGKRSDRLYIAVTGIVIVLVVAAAVVGLLT